MPKPTKGPRIGGSPSHERIILANMASQLFEHGRITTTETRARRVQPLAERLISKAKRGDLHARRLVNQTITDKGIVHVLFTEIAPTMAGRDGGYTRITKVGPRKGDNAPMAIIELVTEKVEPKQSKKSTAKSAEPKAAPVAEEAATDAEFQTVDQAAADADAADAPVDAAGEASKYGENAFEGAEPPAGFDIKGNENSMLYHTPDSPFYEATKAEVWFNSVEAAEAAGFKAPGQEAEEAEEANA